MQTQNEACRQWEKSVLHAHMQPLEVIAHLATPIAITRAEDILLEGILCYQILAHCFQGNPPPLNMDTRLLHLHAPLALRGNIARIEQRTTGTILDCRADLSDQWWYACSTTQLHEVLARKTQTWNKRFDAAPEYSDTIDFGKKTAKVVIENGNYKAYHQRLPTMTVRALSWYVLGDASLIDLLVQDVRFLGKKRAYGYGEVLRWEMREMREDCSTWKDNRLMRPLPAYGLRDTQSWEEPPNFQQIAYRTPAWHVANQALCAMGGKRGG